MKPMPLDQAVADVCLLCMDVDMCVWMCQHPPASAPLDPESEEAWTLMKAMHDPGKALGEARG